MVLRLPKDSLRNLGVNIDKSGQAFVGTGHAPSLQRLIHPLRQPCTVAVVRQSVGAMNRLALPSHVLPHLSCIR